MALVPFLIDLAWHKVADTVAVKAYPLSRQLAPNIPILLRISIESDANLVIKDVYDDDGILFAFVDGRPVRSSLDRMTHHDIVRRHDDAVMYPFLKFTAGRSHVVAIALELYDEGKLSRGTHTVTIEARGRTTSGETFRCVADQKIHVEPIDGEEAIESLRRDIASVSSRWRADLLAATLSAPPNVTRSLWPKPNAEVNWMQEYSLALDLYASFKTRPLREDHIRLGYTLLKAWRNEADKAREAKAKRDFLDYAKLIQHILDRG